MPELLQDLEPVHAGHLDVEEDEVWRFTLDELDAFVAGGGLQHLVAFVFENHPQRVADGGLVVDDQDARLQRDSVRMVRIVRSSRSGS